MSEKDSAANIPNKGIYLLPNLLTTAGLFSGFYAVVSSMNEQYIAASIAIFVAMIFDGLDGGVARLTNTQSEFGAEYDSMADMVSFGIAPSLVAYNWALSDLGKFGWLAAFVYAACAALRLARFNTQVGVADNRYFQGLASPAAAGVIASIVWVGAEFQVDGHDYGFIFAIITAITGVLMVSNFKYKSLKGIDWKGKVNFLVMLVLVLIFAIVAASPPEVLFIIFILYACSGPVITIRNVKRLKLEHVVGDKNSEQDNAFKEFKTNIDDSEKAATLKNVEQNTSDNKADNTKV